MTTQRRSKRAFGDGAIDQRGEHSYRLRYRVNGRRFTNTFHGTLSEARKELRALIRSGDTGEHVAPDKIKLSEWIDQWIAVGAPGRKKKRVSQRTLERYEELLRVHVKPKLGNCPLQKLAATEIDEHLCRARGQDRADDAASRARHVQFVPVDRGAERPLEGQPDASC